MKSLDDNGKPCPRVTGSIPLCSQVNVPINSRIEVAIRRPLAIHRQRFLITAKGAMKRPEEVTLSREDGEVLIERLEKDALTAEDRWVLVQVLILFLLALCVMRGEAKSETTEDGGVWREAQETRAADIRRDCDQWGHGRHQSR